jgi:hypothetical protein
MAQFNLSILLFCAYDDSQLCFYNTIVIFSILFLNKVEGKVKNSYKLLFQKRIDRFADNSLIKVFILIVVYS